MSSAAVATSWPSTRIRPRSGTTNPSSALSIVLLPAPFGPSSPTAPAANDAVTARSACWPPYATVTSSNVTTALVSGIQFVIRWPRWKRSGKGRRRSQRPLQSQRLGALAHEGNHVGDVLLERQPELLRAAAEILALDAAGERFILHALHHRGLLQVENALARPHERCGGDESRHFIARKERLLDRRLARHAGDLRRMREDRADHPLRIAALAQNLAAAHRMITERRPALVVEIMKQRDDAPSLFILAELLRVAAYCGLDGERVLQETLAFGVLGEQMPSLVSSRSHGFMRIRRQT